MKQLVLFYLFSLSFFAHSMGSHPINWDKAIDNAVHRYGLQTEPELIHFFEKAAVAYPPKQIALLAFKKEQKLQLWAKNRNKTWRHIHTYPLTASSGYLGPKLKEHDLQIPEGIYRLTAFNPFSQMHLSMKINYPNAFDRKKAAEEGRKKLGGNIFLHGKSESVGCLAVGDHAINQLFLLSRRVGLNQVQVIIAPNDLRRAKPKTKIHMQPYWLPELYHQIERKLSTFPLREHA
ncbi:MAG: L,D-transpeptidase family protein [Legionellaceae bacterium]|nr:L,D-transpeptidase family protein [Legionellaceae bacterium]